jgi:flagellar motility protein MotE (MotC chaperone)
LFLSLCFVASAAIRVGDVGMAVAQTAAQEMAQAASGPREPTVLRPDAVPAQRQPTLAERAAACDAEPGPLLEAIRERVAALEERERQVAERERLLEVTEARIEAEIGRLEEAEEALAATLAIADGASERDVAHLVGVYETMKPKQAAVIFSSMDPEFAAGFLARMRADAAAGILGQMESGAAYAVTAVMAGRHVGAGRAPDAQPGNQPRR